MRDSRYVGDALCGSCSVWEFCYLGVAVCRSCDVWELPCVGVVVWGNLRYVGGTMSRSYGVRELRGMAIAVCESYGWGGKGVGRLQCRGVAELAVFG